MNDLRLLIACVAVSLAATSPAMGQSRGELLYATHCIACHTTELHWRDQRSARDWRGLKAQVRRWQDAASLAWDDRDILEVTRYLNESIYQFEQTDEAASSSIRVPQRPRSSQSRSALPRSP